MDSTSDSTTANGTRAPVDRLYNPWNSVIKIGAENPHHLTDTHETVRTICVCLFVVAIFFSLAPTNMP